MTQTAFRPAAALFAGILAFALWLPTVSTPPVPSSADLSAAPSGVVELA